MLACTAIQLLGRLRQEGFEFKPEMADPSVQQAPPIAISKKKKMETNLCTVEHLEKPQELPQMLVPKEWGYQAKKERKE